MDFLFVKVAVVCSVGFGWKPKGNDVELNKVNKHGQFRETRRVSYSAGTTLLRFFDMKMKTQLPTICYSETNTKEGKLFL